MSAQRYKRMEEILSTIDILTSDGGTATTVRGLYEFIKKLARNI